MPENREKTMIQSVEYKEIPTTGKYSYKMGSFTVDCEVYGYLSKFIWKVVCKGRYCYAYTKLRECRLYAHDLILGDRVNKKVVGYKNEDTSDLRLANLIITDRSMNRLKQDHKNIYLDKRKNKYYIQFKIDGKHITKGYFSSFEEAIPLRDEMKDKILQTNNNGNKREN